VRDILQKQITEMTSKRQRIQNFIDTLSDKKTHIKKSAKENEDKLRTEIDGLQRTLTEKLSEMTRQIASAANSKEQILDSEVKKAAKQIESIDRSLGLARKCQIENSLRFLAKLDNTIPDIRASASTTTPVVTKSMFTLAPVNLHQMDMALKRMKYKDWKILPHDTLSIGMAFPGNFALTQVFPGPPTKLDGDMDSSDWDSSDPAHMGEAGDADEEGEGADDGDGVGAEVGVGSFGLGLDLPSIPTPPMDPDNPDIVDDMVDLGSDMDVADVLSLDFFQSDI